MSNKTNNNTMSNAELQKRVAELEVKNAELEKALEAKRAKSNVPNPDVKDARITTGMRRLNVSDDAVKNIIGFNPATLRNEGLGRSIDTYSIRNDRYDLTKADEREKHFIAKSIDKSGIYSHPKMGVVYASINIKKAGYRTLYSLDRKGRELLTEALRNVPEDQRVIL